MKILVLNSGSSSLKYQLIDMENEKVLAKGNYEKIGMEGSFVTHKANGEKYTYERAAKNHEEAITFVNRARYEIAKSKEAGFTKNATLIRILERYDVIKTDNDAYIYGELTITDGINTTVPDNKQENPEG